MMKKHSGWKRYDENLPKKQIWFITKYVAKSSGIPRDIISHENMQENHKFLLVKNAMLHKKQKWCWG